MFNPAIFKAYDIRGIFGKDFNEEFAYELGLAFVKLCQSEGKKEEIFKIAVGSDMRLSSPAIKKRLLAGLAAGGAVAYDLGIISTPSLYFAVGQDSYDGGLMISASHNPGEWNGFKLVRKNSKPISGENGLKELQKIIAEKTDTPNSGKIISQPWSVDPEISLALSHVGSLEKKLKIVVDTANGMGAAYVYPLLEKMNLEFVAINQELDGRFPAHEADPLKEENLKQLQAAVIAEKADLGIATDGDGDRIFFVDEKGQTIEAAIIRGLLAREFLKDKPGAKIGYDVRPGKISVDLIKENGGQAVMTKVGHSLIKEQMISENIYFAGESSGHFYWQGPAGCFEYPAVMISRLINSFAKENKKISEYIEAYKKYFHSGEINLEIADKEAALKSLAEKYNDGKISRLDGLSVEYPDFWFNVRASNTEAKLRLNLEAISQEKQKEKTAEIIRLIKGE
jgi:phosphomannomutase